VAARAKKRRRRPRAGQLGSVSKSDFVAIARVLCRRQAPPAIAEDLSDYFQAQNPRFNRGRFLEATKKC
jgi:hypothetical protein